MSETAQHMRVAERFYDALAAADAPAIVELLDPDFHAELTAGLPEGWGGSYHGALDILDRCWRPLYGELAIRPQPTEYLPSGADRVAVLGYYHGRSRQESRAFQAAFAHVLRLRNGRICELIQVTDSARWHEALGRMATAPSGSAS